MSTKIVFIAVIWFIISINSLVKSESKDEAYTEDFHLYFYDNLLGSHNLSGDATLKLSLNETITLHLDVVLENLEFSHTTGINQDSLAIPIQWVAQNPGKRADFAFELRPNGEWFMKAKENSYTSAGKFAIWLVRSVTESQEIKMRLEGNRKPKEGWTDSIFGRCSTENEYSQPDSSYLVKLNVNSSDCVSRNDWISEAAKGLKEEKIYEFKDDERTKSLKKISVFVDYNQNDQTHKIGYNLDKSK